MRHSFLFRYHWPVLSLLLCILFSTAARADYSVSQKHIFYTQDRRSVSVKISNTGKTSREYSVRAHPWDDNTKHLGAEMIAYPPVFELEPGGSQLVRLLLRDKNTLPAPLFFRFVVQETAPIGETNSRKGGGLEVPISTSFPVYYLDRSMKPRATVQKQMTPRGMGVLVTNTGPTLLEIRGAADARGRSQPLNKRILPGRKELFLFQGWTPPYRFQVAYGDDIIVP